MCGLCGIIWNSRGAMQARLGRDILDQLAPRGPDDQGILYFDRNGVSLVEEPKDVESVEAVFLHRRLSIIDLSRAGWQPMKSADGRYFIVFNGEIYNYIELREELLALGFGPFHSESDTEVLLEGYRCWGPAVLHRLIGMFALAILDTSERAIFLARDFFGIKPLYYAAWQNGYAFASEIKALLQLPGVSRRINAQRAYDYLQHNVTDFGGETMFQGISQLPGAHYLTIYLDHVDVPAPIPYWHPAEYSQNDLSFLDASDHLRELFLNGIRLHMRSDVPIGTALSGGIDSSAIVACIRHLYPDAELHSFSYVAEGTEISEEPWIDLAAAHVGATVHKVSPGSQDLAMDLDRLIRIQEEPVGGTSIYAQYRVFQKANEYGVKVMLNGQGADELLGGYKLYLAARLSTLIRNRHWNESIRFILALNKQPMSGGALEQTAYALGMTLPKNLVSFLMRFWGRQATPSWLNVSWFDEHGIERLPHQWRASSTHVLNEMLERTLLETSLPMLLRYEDRNSMAFSIESRVPFLTPPLAEFIFSLPEEYIINAGGTTKAIFRQAMRGIVPDAILDRRDKIGFLTPQKEWLIALKPWVDTILYGATAAEIPLLRIHEVQKKWEIMQGKGNILDFRTAWRWINLIRWVEQQKVTF